MFDWAKIGRERGFWKVVVTTTYLPRLDGIVGKRVVTRIYLGRREVGACCALARELGLPETTVLGDDGLLYLQFREGEDLWPPGMKKRERGDGS